MNGQRAIPPCSMEIGKWHSRDNFPTPEKIAAAADDLHTYGPRRQQYSLEKSSITVPKQRYCGFRDKS